VQQEVGLRDLLERGAEGRDQRVGQFLDEPDRVHEQQLAAAAEPHPAHERVEGHEELVGHPRPAPREGVEQRRLARVGVPHEGHHRHPPAPSRLAPRRALPANVLDLPSDRLDSLPYPPPVGLELGLPGSPGADAAPEAREEHAPTGQPGQDVVELRELDLQASLPGAGPPGEDVQDELGAVDRLASHLRLEVALLGRREVVVEDHHVDALLLAAPREVPHLAAPDEGGGVPPGAFLEEPAHDPRPRAPGEQAELVERGLGPRPVAGAEREPDEQSRLTRAGPPGGRRGGPLPGGQPRSPDGRSLTRVMRALSTR
jgi:hypothetical protein